jgi:hypothetical protein
LKKLTGIAILTMGFLTVGTAHAQQIDIAFGVGTVTAPSAASATGDHGAQSLTGGAYPSFSGDVLIKHNFGFNGEVAWRASENLYQGFQPYRPILYDFNAIWVPRIGKKVSAELMGGIGGESIRFYQPFVTCTFFSCTNFVSSNHFLGHVGGGLRFYLFGNVFVRPEAHAYFIHNNVEFSSGRAQRYGASIGYTFAPHE